jgi:large subunit ribosomal protein L6
MVTLPEAHDHIKLPNGVTASLKGRELTLKGPKGELKRTLKESRVEIAVEKGGVTIRCDLPRRAEKAELGSFSSHVRNMIFGVQNGYEYKMKTVFAHFPIKTTVKGSVFMIENFLGERSARKATILPGVKVDAKGDQISVTGIDLEKVSQTAANIETATKVRRRDIRVFQDGIYITQKAA